MVAAKAITDDCYGGLCIDEGDDHLGWAVGYWDTRWRRLGFEVARVT